jgi:hypothetical protein
LPTKVPHPARVQARRAANYKAVHRPTRYGNPFPITATTPRDHSLALYAQWLDDRLARDPAFLEPLRGFNLGCFCAPNEPCHADILLARLYGA